MRNRSMYIGLHMGSTYRSAPVHSSHMPPGVPFIIGNEGAERFSYYGMRAILVVFMTQALMNADGQLATMNEDEAKGWFHLFISAVYFTPLLGALISDGLLGKFRTIILLSIVYCFGHLVLAIDHTRLGLLIGLAFIALGSGGIKPCVSAHVGDQFGHANEHLLAKMFGWFYFSINLGAFISMLATPWLLATYGPSIAFSIPGVLMLLATLIFWSGRKRFVHIPPSGMRFVKETISKSGLKTLGNLSIIYVFVAVFWALFDQTGSAWVLQAQHMDRHIFGFEVLPSQMQAANPLLVLLLIPLFSYVLYPAIERIFTLTELRKIAIGMFITVIAFAIPTWIQMQIDSGLTPHIGWQMLAYIVLTCAEVMISITCLEFSYTQAPKKMKSFVMAFFMLSISVGNLFTSAVNFLIENPDGTSKLAGADYYLFFTGLMLIAAIAFTFSTRFYKGERHIHADQPDL
ncbi:MAG: POT family MFS transporter [Mariprofundaceae bacterium]